MDGLDRAILLVADAFDAVLALDDLQGIPVNAPERVMN
jgi:hypothetical protein